MPKTPKTVTPFRSALEIGTGSGFLTKLLIHNLPCLKSIIATDVDIQAIRCAEANVRCILWGGTSKAWEKHLISDGQKVIPGNLLDLGGPIEPRVAFLLGEDLEVLKPKSIDLIVVNPPYIPAPKEVRLNAVAGTKLMGDILTGQANRLLSKSGIMFMIYSNLAEEQFASYLEKSPCLVAKVILTRKVRLDIKEVNEDQAWIRHLQGLGLEAQETAEGPLYWHDLKVVLVHRKDWIDNMSLLG